MSLGQEFTAILALCEQLEGVTLPPRIKLRIAHAFERAVEKVLTLKWNDADMTDSVRLNRALLRHAERGARDFLP